MHPGRAPKKRHLPALRHSKKVFLVESFLGTFCWVSNGHALKYSSNCLGFSDRGSFFAFRSKFEETWCTETSIKKKFIIWSPLLLPVFLARTLDFKQKMFVLFDSKFKLIPFKSMEKVGFLKFLIPWFLYTSRKVHPWSLQNGPY